MLSQINTSIGSFLPQLMKQRSLNNQNQLQLQLLWKSFLCRLFFQMIETNYVPTYMQINHIFFVIKCQFPVMDYNDFNVYCRELAPVTVSLTGDRAQGDANKQWAYSIFPIQ